MTKTCVEISQNHRYKSLHEFLKSKRKIVKYAKRESPNKSWIDNFNPLSVTELHGSFWVGDRLFRKRGCEIIFLATNKLEPTTPNSNPEHPKEIIIKSCPVEFSSPLRHEKDLLFKFAPCKNLVHCYGDEITTTNSGEKMYNVLFEYCSGSNLRDHLIDYGLRGLPELEVRRFTRDIVHGLHYLHCDARYVHGDIKPRNILLLRNNDEDDSFVAKIGSFGLAKKLTPDVLCDRGICNSGPYTSPELARDGGLDWPADVWALGCLVLEMLMGKLSFDNAYEVSEMLPQIPKEISRVGRDFIKKCLVTSPYKRRPVWLLIKHPFVCL